MSKQRSPVGCMSNDERFNCYVEQVLTNELIRQSDGDISEEDARVIAKDIASKIDWNNSALMHKGLVWIVSKYLNKY